MITDMILRCALSGAQKQAANIAAKLVTTTASTIVGVSLQNSITKKESEKLLKQEQVTENDVKKAQMNAAVKGGLANGTAACAGLAAFYALNNVINKA